MIFAFTLFVLPACVIGARLNPVPQTRQSNQWYPKNNPRIPPRPARPPPRMRWSPPRAVPPPSHKRWSPPRPVPPSPHVRWSPLHMASPPRPIPKTCFTVKSPALRPPSITISQWEKQMFENAQHMFPGLFCKNDTYPDFAKTHDGDSMCPTLRCLEAAGEFMRNTFGQIRNIVQFPSLGEFQFIHKGVCVDQSLQGCTGTCVLETSIVYLLVWHPDGDPDLPVKFESFAIPSYCSCKNIFLG